MSDSFATPWAIAHQAPLSMGFPRQEYCSGLPFPSPGDLPDPGIEPVSSSLADRFPTPVPPGLLNNLSSYGCAQSLIILGPVSIHSPIKASPQPPNTAPSFLVQNVVQSLSPVWLCDLMDCSTPGFRPLPSPRACSNSCPLNQRYRVDTL